MSRNRLLVATLAATALAAVALAPRPARSRTQKPAIYARHWLAITGKPLAATAGARIFERGGNAVDAACAMLAATCTMWDTHGWGGETQALVWHPGERRVVAVNALGVAPTGATASFFRERNLRYPPEYGPLAAITPGTPGGLLRDARRVGEAAARRGARAGDRDGARRLSDRSPARRLAPRGTASGSPAGRSRAPSSCRTPASRRPRASCSASPTSRARSSAWSTPSAPRSPPASGRRGGDPRRRRAVLPRRRSPASWSPRRAPRARSGPRPTWRAGR